MFKILVWLCPLFLLADSALDSQINLLQSEIEALRIKALNDKEKAQENLRYQGDATVHEVESAEKYEDIAAKKQKELDLLLQKRNQLPQ